MLVQTLRMPSGWQSFTVAGLSFSWVISENMESAWAGQWVHPGHQVFHLVIFSQKILETTVNERKKVYFYQPTVYRILVFRLEKWLRKHLPAEMLFKGNGCIFKKGNSANNVFASSLNRGQLWKGKCLLLSSKFFSFDSRPIFQRGSVDCIVIRRFQKLSPFEKWWQML